MVFIGSTGPVPVRIIDAFKRAPTYGSLPQ
jgi:hypothetical protein